MKGYISVRGASYKWSISERRANPYCMQGRIPAPVSGGRGVFPPMRGSLPTPAKTNPAREEMNVKADNGPPVSVGTSTLLRRILKAANLRSFLDENEQSLVAPAFTEYLEMLCQERNMVREHVIGRAGIERGFGHQLFRGSRKPSRDNVLRLAFGFGLTVDETQALLRIARRTPLYPRIERDSAIIYGLSHHNTIIEIQSSLNDLGLTVLGGERYEHFEG